MARKWGVAVQAQARELRGRGHTFAEIAKIMAKEGHPVPKGTLAGWFARAEPPHTRDSLFQKLTTKEPQAAESLTIDSFLKGVGTLVTVVDNQKETLAALTLQLTETQQQLRVAQRELEGLRRQEATSISIMGKLNNRMQQLVRRD